MVSRSKVAGTDVTYEPVDAEHELVAEVERITAPLGSKIGIVFGTSIRRVGNTYAGMYVGPPASLIIVDPAQSAQPQLNHGLAVATAIHERAHAQFTPDNQEEHQLLYRNKLTPTHQPLYDGLLEVLEDERIETIVVRRWPELRSPLAGRWKYMLESQGELIHSSGVLRAFGPQSVLVAAKLDYLHQMLGRGSWYRNRAWHPFDGDLSHVLSQIRKIKRASLSAKHPNMVPKLAYEIVRIALRRAAM